MIEGELNSEEQQNVPSPVTEEPTVPQVKNYLSKKRILFYCLLLLLVFIFIMYVLIRESKTKSVNPKIFPTPSVSQTISPTLSGSNHTNPTIVASPTAAFVPDQLIVQYKLNQTPEDLTSARKAEIDKILSQVGVISEEKVYNSEDSSLRRYYVLKFKKGTDLTRIKNILKTIPEIENAEQNNIVNTNN